MGMWLECKCQAVTLPVIMVSAYAYLNPMKTFEKMINNGGFTGTRSRYLVKCIH